MIDLRDLNHEARASLWRYGTEHAIILEQLNEVQWHAVSREQGSGVGSYIDAMADALWMAERQRCPIIVDGFDAPEIERRRAVQ